MTTRIWILARFCVALALAQSCAPAADSFTQTVRPILMKNCLGCHNAQVHRGGFDASSYASLMKGSDNGPVIVPGDADRSTLFKLITHSEQPAMPFKGPKMGDESIAIIAK